MWCPSAVTMAVLGLGFLAGMALGGRAAAGGKGRGDGHGKSRGAPPRYLRMSIARWTMNLHSPEAEAIFQQIATDGVAVFRAQPGFVRYRLMRADSGTTIAVAEWESEQLGQAGAERYRAWMRSAGIMDRFTLETHAGDIVAAS